MRDYLALPVQTPREPRLILASSEAHADLGDPASAVFTDLRVAPSVVVPAGEALPDTRRLMQLAGVRMAFVVEGSSNEVVGFVTAADLQGERSMVAASRRMASHHDLTAADVMTPVADWVTIDASRLANARVGDIAATFRAASERYLIAMETEPGGQRVVRGLFSANRVERALGHTIAVELRSRSFADLAQALGHG
ncbi:MAG: hypothetical protein JSR59_00225 [Proteobacteria bacterium]|nr:hypothetical protein [Pseudomonadota bacterium]